MGLGGEGGGGEEVVGHRAEEAEALLHACLYVWPVCFVGWLLNVPAIC